MLVWNAKTCLEVELLLSLCNVVVRQNEIEELKISSEKSFTSGRKDHEHLRKIDCTCISIYNIHDMLCLSIRSKSSFDSFS